MAYLADTNIVSRRVLPDDPLHALVRAATRMLDEQGETVYITAQKINIMFAQQNNDFSQFYSYYSRLKTTQVH